MGYAIGDYRGDVVEDKDELETKFAIEWAQRLGCNTKEITELRGGINNHVYRIGGKDGFVVKRYPTPPAGSRDRMYTEIEFLSYSNEAATGYTPELVLADTDKRCLVMRFVEGEIFEPDMKPSQNDIERAIEFVKCLNADKSKAYQNINTRAAEGFDSINEHITNIANRIMRMQCNHIRIEERGTAVRLLERLKSDYSYAWNILGGHVERKAIRNKIEAKQLCLSPGDFGFHNAIRCASGTKFIDFEFGGWDDAAKLILDFSLQPRIPVEDSLPHLAKAFPKTEQGEIIDRCNILRPIFSIKWKCIILSVLDKERLKRIIEAHPELNADELIRERLLIAESYNDRVDSMSDW